MIIRYYNMRRLIVSLGGHIPLMVAPGGLWLQRAQDSGTDPSVGGCGVAATAAATRAGMAATAEYATTGVVNLIRQIDEV
jgi:hypothetical protein